jgi:Ca2+-binding EF-hand superfamily protein
MLRWAVVLMAATGATAALAQTAPPKEGRGAAFFQKADADGDGAVSRKEWLAAGRREKGFERIDADHSGTITPAELEAAASRMRAARAKQAG